MNDHVALIDQLCRQRLVLDRIDSVVKAGVVLEMGYVPDTAGGQIVEHENFVAAL